MPQVIEMKVFKVDELSSPAQQKAWNWWLSLGLEEDWYEHIEAGLRERLKDIGFDLEATSYSIGSQGQGACFTGEIRDARKFLWATDLWRECPHLMVYHEYLSGHLYKVDRFYSHENTVAFSCDMGSWEPGLDEGVYESTCWPEDEEYVVESALLEMHDRQIAEQMEIFEQRSQNILRDMMREVFRILEDEYDYQTSEETFKEACHANDYLFFEDGNIA